MILIWIQTIKMYFDAARIPLEHRTEIAVTYLKEDAMQWWSGAHTTPILTFPGIYSANI
jgi:hypothetical protein